MKALSIYPAPKADAMSNRVDKLNSYLRGKFDLIEFPVNLRKPLSKTKIICESADTLEVNIFMFAFISKHILKDVSIVFVHTAVGGLMSLFLSRKINTHVDWHGIWEEEYLLQNPGNKILSVIFRYLEKKILSRANSISVVTEEVREFLCKKYSLEYEKILIAPNGYEEAIQEVKGDKRDNTYNQIKKFVKDKHVVLYAGGGQSWQGVEKLYAASKILEKKFDNYAVLICGVSNEISASGCVLEVPRLSRNMLFSIMNLAGLFVIPRPISTVNLVAMPTKLVEYASVGRAILSTPIGATSRLIEENNLGLVTFDDSCKAVAEGIINYFSMDEDLRREISSKNIEFSRKYRWSNVFDKIGCGL